MSDKGKRMVEAINSDAENRGRFQSCQQSHLSLVKIMFDLIDAGVLKVVSDKNDTH